MSMNLRRLPLLSTAFMMFLPWMGRADVVLNATLNPTPSSYTAYYSGLDTTIVTTDLYLASGPALPDLSSASGNLIVNLLAPLGSRIEILATVSDWSASVRFNAGSTLSFFGSFPMSVDFVNLIGSMASQAGSGVVYNDSLALGALEDLQMNLLSSEDIPSGTTFDGLAFSMPVSAFSGLTTAGTPTYDGLIRLSLWLPGDQTSTAPAALARFVDVSDVPEPGTALLLGIALAALVVRKRG